LKKIIISCILLTGCTLTNPTIPVDYTVYTNQIKITKDSSFGTWFEWVDTNEYNLVYSKNTYSFYKKIYLFSDFPGYAKINWYCDSIMYMNHVNEIYWNRDSTLYDYDFPIIKIPIINKTSIDNDGEFETIFGINRSYAYVNNVFKDLTISELIRYKFINKSVFIRVYMYDYVQRDSKNRSPTIYIDSIKINFVER
jgi:hypothetical protein